MHEAKKQLTLLALYRFSPVTLSSLRIPQAEDAKYLELHRVDCKPNWKKHIITKREQLGLQLGKIYQLLGSKSQLSTENKLLYGNC